MKLMVYFILAVAQLVGQSVTWAAVQVQIKKVAGHTQILSIQNKTLKKIKKQGQILRHIPYFIDEYAPASSSIYEVRLYDEAYLPSDIAKFKSPPKQFVESATEVRTLIHQGPKENRINLTILGDGYLQSEKEKFFADADRTAKGLFAGQTFNSYLPLFNVYAVFVPSNKSGIGDGSPIDTAFQLYRTPKGSKRAIYPGNESALEQALRLAPATDYPIVLANDEFYGGLGGRYAISTSSERSGLIVLRHELGHNFGEVGEEYDNGSAYMGANSSRSANVPWKHWAEAGGIHSNEAKIVTGDYVWQNLKDGAYKANFRTNSFPGGYFFGEISSVGWETPQDVTAKIDGINLALEGAFNLDRNFYSLPPVKDFAAGNHVFQVEENIQDGDNVLGFAVLFEAASDYDFTKNKIGAYSTFSDSGSKSYRPTHDSCLMRNMASETFCSVDKENIWQRFLERVSLIDEVVVTPTSPGFKIRLSTIPLQGLQIRWYQKSGNAITELKDIENQTEWISQNPGSYRVEVQFRTEEVRKYNSSFADQKDFNLSLR